jgi:hypothetical protein
MTWSKPDLREVPESYHAAVNEIIREFGIQGRTDGGLISIRFDVERQRLVVTVYRLQGDIEIRQAIGGKP